MVASLFLTLKDKFLPFKYTNENLTKALNQIFSEVETYYGAEVVEDFELYLDSEDGSFLTLNTTTGFEIGRYQQPRLRALIYAQNATTPRELAIELDMDLEAVLNITMDNYLVYVHAKDMKATKVSIVTDKVGITRRERIIDALVAMGMQLAVTGINAYF